MSSNLHLLLILLLASLSACKSAELGSSSSGASFEPEVASSGRARRQPISASFQPTTKIPTVITSLAFQRQAPLARHQTSGRLANFSELMQANLAPALCQVAGSHLGPRKCSQQQESSFQRTALAEFQMRLSETSFELSQLISNHLDEFKSLSLDSIEIAKENTLIKLTQQANIVKLLQFDLQPITNSLKNLFELMQNHLERFDTNLITNGIQSSESAQIRLQQSTMTALPTINLQATSTQKHIVDIDHEIDSFFNRLRILSIKRQLERNSKLELDTECIGANLKVRHQEDTIENELFSSSLNQLNEINLDRELLIQSMKQSLEFARILLNSLNLGKSIFDELTSKSDEWIPKGACRIALARMTICPQCYSNGDLNLIQAPPCENYCLNIVNGCINDVYELNRFWSEHVNALDRFKTNFIKMNNIENVMLSLDEKLNKFLEKQFNLTSATNNIKQQSNLEQINLISTKVSQLCSRARPNSGQFRSAGRLRPAGLVLPANQPPAKAAGRGALKSRQSATQSLFNRLDELALRLRGSRDFFAGWPARICHKIRHNGNQKTLNQELCWNGQDFSGYNKALVQFGQPISSNHPEVATAKSQPVNQMVLNFVARLKDIGGQLARRSARSANLVQLSSYAAEALVSLAAGEQAVGEALASALPKRSQATLGDLLKQNSSQAAQHKSPLAISILSEAAANDEEPALAHQTEANDNSDSPNQTDEATNGGSGSVGSNPDESNNNEEGEGEEEEVEEEEEDDGEEPHCTSDNCGELFTSNPNEMTHISSSPEPTIDPVETSRLSPELPAVTIQMAPPRRVPQFTPSLPKYQMPTSIFDGPVGGNEIGPFIAVVPEFIERQSSSAERSQLVTINSLTLYLSSILVFIVSTLNYCTISRFQLII